MNAQDPFSMKSPQRYDLSLSPPRVWVAPAKAGDSPSPQGLRHSGNVCCLLPSQRSSEQSPVGHLEGGSRRPQLQRGQHCPWSPCCCSHRRDRQACSPSYQGPLQLPGSSTLPSGTGSVTWGSQQELATGPEPGGVSSMQRGLGLASCRAPACTDPGMRLTEKQWPCGQEPGLGGK